MLKVNNKKTLNIFHIIFSASIVDYEQVNIRWV